MQELGNAYLFEYKQVYQIKRLQKYKKRKNISVEILTKWKSTWKLKTQQNGFLKDFRNLS